MRAQPRTRGAPPRRLRETAARARSTRGSRHPPGEWQSHPVRWLLPPRTVRGSTIHRPPAADPSDTIPPRRARSTGGRRSTPRRRLRNGNEQPVPWTPLLVRVETGPQSRLRVRIGIDQVFNRNRVALPFGPFVLDLDTRQLLRDGAEVHLSPKAFQLLAILVERRPAALSKAALLEQLWPATFVAEANLPNLIGEIRAAIGDDPHSPAFIRTVSRFGYAFSAEVDGPAPSAREATHEFKLARDGRHQLLCEGENLIGRTNQSGSWFDSISVSRRHARIIVRGDSASVEDLGSKNGTYVDDVKITAATPLVSGALIRFGSIAVRFRIDLLDDTTMTAAE